MIGAWSIRDLKLSAKEGGGEFGNEFLEAIGFVAKALTEFTVETVFCADPMTELLKLGRVIGFGGRRGFGAGEELARRKNDEIGRWAAVVGAISTMLYDRAGGGDKGFDMIETFREVDELRLRRKRIVLHLSGIEAFSLPRHGVLEHPSASTRRI